MEQILKFGVVGVLATLIDYGLLMLLSQLLHVDAVIAAGISFTASLVFNYLASMRYVFTRRDDISRGREFAVFVVLSLAGLALNQLCMWAGVALLGSGALAVTVSKVFATAVVMVWNFLSRKKWLDAGERPEAE
jgi:putative flippase GtrA